VNEIPRVTGRCLCGDIRYEYSGAPVKVLHCHCESCRRHTSSPVATFVCVNTDAFCFTKGTPAVFESSHGVKRMHCARCGSPIAYRSDRNPHQIDLYLGTLADPEASHPSFHVFAEEQLDWFEIADALPRYAKGQRGAIPVRHGSRQINVLPRRA